MPSRERLVLGAPHMAAVKAPVTGTAFPSSRTMVVSAWSSAASATYFSGLTFAHDADAGGWQASSPVFWPVDGTLDFLQLHGAAAVSTSAAMLSFAANIPQGLGSCATQQRSAFCHTTLCGE